MIDFLREEAVKLTLHYHNYRAGNVIVEHDVNRPINSWPAVYYRVNSGHHQQKQQSVERRRMAQRWDSSFIHSVIRSRGLEYFMIKNKNLAMPAKRVKQKALDETK